MEMKMKIWKKMCLALSMGLAGAMTLTGAPTGSVKSNMKE